MSNMPLLEVKNVSKHFGGLTALNDVSFSVDAGEIRGLIGPNGAGKSTMFKNIAGFYKPTQGDILFEGRSISGLAPHDISSLGIVRTFQETTLFQELTVYQNILVGCHLQAKTNIFAAVFGLDRTKHEQARERAMQAMDFMGLTDRKEQLAAELPLGSQRTLAIATALASSPKLLLMDEPFAGMNPEETRYMMELTQKVNKSGITIVLVEHDMKAVMGLCKYITVLNFGTLLAEGSPAEISEDAKVVSAYLGGGHRH